MLFYLVPSKTMKLISCLSIVVTCLTLLGGLTNVVVTNPQGSGTVPSHLGNSGTFYRGIYKTTIQALEKDYVNGKSPTGHSTAEGDFAPEGTGGFYVFDVSSHSTRICIVYSYLYTE
jgi:hypothetical protein